MQNKKIIMATHIADDFSCLVGKTVNKDHSIVQVTLLWAQGNVTVSTLACNDHNEL